MTTPAVLLHVRQQGQVRDVEIAKTLGLDLDVVRSSLDELSAMGNITCCNVIRYSNGRPMQEILCRMSGYVPPAAPGRKPKS